ncbi:DUF3850 domain-containing protein [Chryseobacterium sp. 2R14A]|uniref:DUF3850 domain-containing protein n=1 Tax=Chryseobacterium sp. 2R14A TaxID=3380353 RepID=UPI003CF7B545
MKVHELKTVNPYFEDVWNLKKNFEVRKNDRHFKVGDKLKLLEVRTDGKRERLIYVKITYILSGGQYGIDKDYVVLGIQALN